MIECLIPNNRAVQALIVGGYLCEELGGFRYRINAPLQEGVPFEVAGERLKMMGGKVFPIAKASDLALFTDALQRMREEGEV